MALIVPAILPVGITSLKGWQVTWGPMQNGDVGIGVGSPIDVAISYFGNIADLAGFADHSVEVDGIFGAGGNLAWQGSNSGSAYGVLTDPYGNVLNITPTSRPVQQWTEATIYVRPAVTAGDGTTSLTVTAFFRCTSQQPGIQV